MDTQLSTDQDIYARLQQEFPGFSTTTLRRISALIGDVIDQRLPPEAADQQIAELFAAADGADGLAGRTVKLGPAQISFAGSTIDGGVTIGSVAGRDIVTVHVTLLAENPHEVKGLISPYLGLKAYSYEDRASFAGREAQIDDLVRKIVAPGAQRPILFITGPSGSGKSSFAQAGLIPELEKHYQRLGIAPRHAVVRPGRAPLAGLVAGLHQLGIATQQIEVRAGPELPGRLIEAIRQATPDGQVNLLLIDQFEELFSQADPEQAAALIRLLAEPLSFEELRTHIIITLRSDFLPELFTHKALYNLSKAGVDLRAMNEDELKLAIKRPLQVAYPDRRFEPALLERLARDAASDATYLPLLQATLAGIWEGGSLSLASHGTLTDAISQRADRVYRFAEYGTARERARGADEQAVVMGLFLDLVNVSLNDELSSSSIAESRRDELSSSSIAESRRDTRRRRSIAELTRMNPARAPIIDELVGARLLSKGLEPRKQAEAEAEAEVEVEVVDIIHESLIVNWGSLRDAIEKHRERLEQRARFELALREWKTHAKSDEYVLRGGRLSEAESLAASGDIAMSTPGAQAFLLHSQKATRRDFERLWSLALALAIVAVLAIGAAITAGLLNVQSQHNAELARQNESLAEARRLEAERQTIRAQAQALAANAIAELENDPERSILLATEAISTTRSISDLAVPQAEEALHRSLLASPLRMTLRGHTAMLIDASYSHDGQRIVTASDDGTARIWDASSGQSLMTLSGHFYSLFDVDYSPDQRLIGAAGDDGALKLWDARSGEELPAWKNGPSTDTIYSLAFSSDGRRVALAYLSDANIDAQVWDIERQQPVVDLVGHDGYVLSVAYSPDETRLVTASTDKTAKVWDAQTGQELLTLAGHDERLISATYSPDGRTIVTASWDQTVRLWDAQSGEMLAVLTGHTDKVRAAEFSPDGATILSAGWDTSPIVWDARTHQPRFVLEGHHSKITKAIFSPDGKLILTADESGLLKLWDAAAGDELATIVASSDMIRGIAFSGDGRQILSVGDGGVLQIWDTQTHQLRQTHGGQPAGLISAEFSPDGRRVVTASKDKTAKIWDVQTGQVVHTLRGHTETVLSAAFSPDGKQIITGSDPPDGSIRIWDAQTGEQIRSLQPDTVGVLKPKYSPDGQTVVSSIILKEGDLQASNITTIWDPATGEVLQRLKGHDVPGNANFSPDGRLVVVPYRDGPTKIWDVQTGEELVTLWRHNTTVLSAAFSPDGQSVVTAAGMDGRIKLWDAQTGELRRAIVIAQLTAFKATFSPDGRSILSAHIDGTARVWSSAGSDEGLRLQFDGLSDQTESILDGPIGDDGVAYSPDGQSIAAANMNNDSIAIWDARTGRQMATLHDDEDVAKFPLMTPVFSPDGRELMGSDPNDTIFIWDRQTMRLRLTLEGYHASYCPDGRIVGILAGDPKGVRVWDRDGHEVATFDGHQLAESGVISAACSPDGRSLAMATGRIGTRELHRVLIWDIATGQVRATITGHDEIIVSVRYSPNGTSLLTASFDNTAKIWDAETYALRLTLTGHTGGVRIAEYSPDGRWIITGGLDGSLRLWDAHTGELRFALSHLPSMIAAATFSPDSKSIAVAYINGQILRYSIDVDDLLTLAQSRVTRALTPEERAQFLGEPLPQPTPTPGP